MYSQFFPTSVISFLDAIPFQFGPPELNKAD